MFDRTSNDVTFSTGYNMRNTIARINDSSRERTICNFVRGPGRCKCKDCLYGNIKALDIEGFEKYLSCLFSVFWRIERRFGLFVVQLDYVPIDQCLAHQKEIMIFWFSPQILEDGLLPVSFHVIPIVNHSVPNWIVNAVTGRFHVSKSFITNEEVEVFNTSFRSKMPWFIWNGRCTRRL